MVNGESLKNYSQIDKLEGRKTLNMQKKKLMQQYYYKKLSEPYPHLQGMTGIFECINSFNSFAEY